MQGSHELLAPGKQMLWPCICYLSLYCLELGETAQDLTGRALHAPISEAHPGPGPESLAWGF